MAEKFIGKVEILANPSATSPTITLDGEKGNLSANGTAQANTLATNKLVLDGADNHILFTHSKTRAYTIGINGDKSSIGIANDQRNYTITLDGQKGDLWASNKLQTTTLAAKTIVLDGPDNGILFTHSKTRAYTIGMNADTSSINIANDQRNYTIMLDGQKGNLWASNQIQTNSLAANKLSLDGADNHILFAHSQTRTYTIGINGDRSLMSFANSQSRNYTIWLDGENGDITLSNADCAEDFDVSEIETAEPGTVMVIDENGKLCPSTQAYDKKVAGVISGAGDYKPGMVLDRHPGSKDRMPVALMGKVYCKVDAQYGAIEVGDLLTTSSTSGYAMKVTDAAKAFGAVIGKALRPLKAGQGLIPILISLQ